MVPLKLTQRQVVAYTGDLLLQGAHNHVEIRLLKETIEDSKVDTYMTQRTPSKKALEGAQKGVCEGSAWGAAADGRQGFAGDSLKDAMAPCAVCSKTVYAMEFVGIGGKVRLAAEWGADHAAQALHKTCFRCIECSRVLQNNTYCTLDDKYYCQAHYEQMCKAKFF